MRKSKRHGLYQREGIYAFRYKDREGRWREKYTGKIDFKQALKFKQDFERELEGGNLPTEKSKWTVEQAASLWVEQHVAHLGSDKVKSNDARFCASSCGA